MTISTNSLLRLLELIFFDFFVSGVAGFVAFQVFNAGAETASLAAYLVGAATFLAGFKLLRMWEIVKKTTSQPLVKLGQ